MIPCKRITILRVGVSGGSFISKIGTVIAHHVIFSEKKLIVPEGD